MKNRLNKFMAIGVATTVLLSGIASAQGASVYVQSNNQIFGNIRDQIRGWVHQGDNDKYYDPTDASQNVDFNKNGEVTVRSGTVTSINGSMITVNTVLGPATLTWTATIDGNTKFQAKNGKQMSLSDITVNDKVTLKGIMQSGSTLAMRATLIRDTSKSITPVVTDTRQTFEGTVTAAPGATLPTSFTIKIGNTPQIVNLAVNSQVLGVNWTALPLTSIMVGDRVRVFGYIPAGTTYVTGLVLRDTSR